MIYLFNIVHIIIIALMVLLIILFTNNDEIHES